MTNERPTFPEGTPFKKYTVETVERHGVDCVYTTPARSEKEAKWLVREGMVAYDQAVKNEDDTVESIGTVKVEEERYVPTPEEIEELGF